MRALLVNPWDRTITETDGDFAGIKAIYAALSGPERKVGCFCSVRLAREEILWVDDDGLLHPGVPVFRLQGYDNPLAGRGLILGVTEIGDNQDSRLTVEAVKAAVLWTDQETTGQLAPTITEGPVITIGAPILRKRTT